MRFPRFIVLIAAALVASILVPSLTNAQHGRGGGGGGWGGGGPHGGGFQGGGGPGGGFHGGGPAGGPAHVANNFHPGGPPHAPGPGPGHFAGYGNRPGYHGGWYHGDWGGHWGGGPWGYRPWGWGWYGGYGYGFGYGLGWGLGVSAFGVGVGLGSPWSWGYYNYYNPYWSPMYGGPTYINYSQPVVVTPAPVAAQPATQYAQPYPQPGPQYSQPAPPPSGVNPYGISPSASAPPAAQSPEQQRGIALFDAARQAFQIGDYRGAQDQTEKAIAYLPNDSLMHEFRALCMFARGDYKPAAAAIYAVVSAGPGWDWTTVANLYPDISVYSMQLRALEGYCKQNTTSAEARFLLAYHYMLGGHNSEAASLLRDVVQLQPNDQLSAQLLKGLTTPQDQTAEPAQAAAEPDTAVDPASLLGVWKANRPDGSKFELQLTPEHKFSWKFSQQDKQQNITGSYTLANNFLILSASDQNALVGKVALQPGNQLKFKLTGGNPAEPGITFTR